MGRELSSFVLAMCNETGSSARWPRCTRAHGVAADTRSSSSRSAQPPRPRRHPPARGSGGQPGECNRWRSTRLPSDRPLGRQAESRSRRRRADRFPDDIIAQHKRWPAAHRLRVEVAPDHHVGVLETRGEDADTHLAPASRRQGSVDHLQLLGTTEAPDLNNPVAQLTHRQISSSSDPAHEYKMPQNPATRRVDFA